MLALACGAGQANMTYTAYPEAGEASGPPYATVTPVAFDMCGMPRPDDQIPHG